MRRRRATDAAGDVTAQTAHIELDLRLDEDGLRGEACRDAGPPQVFSGWLGLISAIDGLLDEDTGEDSS